MCAPETRCDAVCLPRSDAAQRVEVRAPQLRADLVKVSLRAQARRPYRLLDFCASRMMRFTSERRHAERPGDGCGLQPGIERRTNEIRPPFRDFGNLGRSNR